MISILLLSFFLPLSLAGKDCVWILGRVQCQHDPSKNLNVEVRVWDRDSFGPFKIIDPDDLMGVTFSNEDGRFQLDGCGDDFDWIPGLNNKIEPYIEIRHFCNSDVGEVITLPQFKVFVPQTYDIGTIILDSDLGSSNSNQPQIQETAATIPNQPQNPDLGATIPNEPPNTQLGTTSLFQPRNFTK